jgi:hypothetical protein
MRNSLHKLPCITTYEEAAFQFKNIKPLRGSENIRPLADRRAKHYSIQKHDDDYVCTLYGHSVLTFSKDEDGSTILTVDLCGYNTQTTRGFISRIAVLPCYSFRGKTYIDIGRGKGDNAYHLPAHYPLQIKSNQCLNPLPLKKKVLDREITKELRDKFKDSMADAEAMLRLGMARISSGNGMSDGGYNPRERFSYYTSQFLDDLTKEEVAEYLWLTGSNIMRDKWQTQKLQYNMQTQKYEDVGRPNPPYRTFIVGALYHVALLDYINIYKEVDVPIGQRA